MAAKTSSVSSTSTTSRVPRRWSVDEDAVLKDEADIQLAAEGEIKNWNKIAEKLPGRSNKDCRKRFYNEVAGGLKKGTWTKDEDERLKKYVGQLGPSWTAISQRMKNRSADQCSKRWTHCLNPDLDHSEWTEDETAILLSAERTHGTSWKEIQRLHLPGRSANALKNQFNYAQRRGIKPPPDAQPCCAPSRSSSTEASNAHSPLSMQSLSTDASSIVPGDLNFGVPSFEIPNFQTDFGSIDPTGLHHSLPSTLTGSADPAIPSMTDSDNRSTSATSDKFFSYLDQHSQHNLNKHHASRHDSLFQDADLMDFALNSDPAFQPNSNYLQEPITPESGDGMDFTGPASLDQLSPSMQTGSNRVTLTLDNLEQENLFAVMNILVKSKANVKLELQQQSPEPR